MSVLKGDYIGFSYGTNPKTGKPMHSSDLGIVRTSDGSRFNENLLPTMQDKTVQVPGGDGTYYFGSYYTQRQFSVSFAFDSLTEEQITTLKRHFGDKKIHDLIFDETPYKIYRAKVTGTATLKYIPFAEGSTNRLYKGEGTIQFTCYDPFARCVFSSSDISTNLMTNGDLENWKQSLKTTYPNLDEWWDAARINEGINFGDVPVPFKLKIVGNDSTTVNGKTISWKLGEEVEAQIDTKTGVVLKLDSSGNPTTELMNEFVEGNLTSKIPVGDNVEGAIYTCLYI